MTETAHASAARRVRALRGAAPAKLNLGLAVTGRRPDGYHELVSVMLRVGLSDGVAVGPPVPGAPDSLTITGDPACVVDGNLVLRALTVLRSAVPGGTDLAGLPVVLTKRIPMGGGLAGGSSDAATALRLAAAAWALPEGAPDLALLGAGLGADVPFFVAGHASALVTGIGERQQPLPGLRPPVGVLLVTPPFGIATPAAFARLDALPRPGPYARATVRALARDWALDPDGVALSDRASALRDANDLWPAAVALEPRLGRLRDALEATLGRPVLLTGSGSTLVGLYPSSDAAHAAAATLRSDPIAGAAGLRIAATTSHPPTDEGP